MIVSGFLADEIKLTKLADHTAAGTTDVDSIGVDMTGYDGVLFLSSFGTAASGNSIEAQVSATVSGTYASLTGTLVASGTSDEDVWLDIGGGVADATKPFIRVKAKRGTSSTCESIWAIQYRARSVAISNVVSGTIIGEKHTQPAEGTA